MAKKQLSFAEKAAKKKGKSDIKYVKYVNSLKSEKTKQWRFNERMIALEGGESLDAALKRMEEEKNILNIELPDPNETPASVDEASPETDEVEPSIPEEEESSSDNNDLGHDKKNDDGDTNQEKETNRKDIPDSETNDSNDVENESGLKSESQAEDSKEK